MDIVDPRKIKESDLPLVILVDDRRGLLGFLIKWHSKGNYNHICEMHVPGFVASQDPVGFRKKPIESYMRPFYHLIFWKHGSMTEDQKQKWTQVIKDELNLPWWKRRYDYLGILGQMLHIRWIQNPFIKYCSERVAENMRKVFQLLIPKHRTPSEMNMTFHGIKEMKVFGYWFKE